MGYKFQFITLAGFHALNYGCSKLAHGYKARQMSAYVELQEKEFAAEKRGYTAVKHQREVGTGYFDAITQTIQGGKSSTRGAEGQHRGRAVPGSSVSGDVGGGKRVGAGAG
jgi:isocitrate lyase